MQRQAGRPAGTTPSNHIFVEKCTAQKEVKYIVVRSHTRPIQNKPTRAEELQPMRSGAVRCRCNMLSLCKDQPLTKLGDEIAML